MRCSIVRRRRLLSGVFTLELLGATACGDPCIDDGYPRPGAECEVEGDGDGTGLDGASDADLDEAGESADELGSADGSGDEADGTVEGSGSAESGTTSTYCQDRDGDGFGDASDCNEVPEGEAPPDGTVPEEQATDCDDDDDDTFPGAAENESADACMTDGDEDGYGDDTPSAPGAEAGTDCDDSEDYTHPGAAQFEGPNECMTDRDDDGYGDLTPDGDVTPGTDCDDIDPSVFACTLYCADVDLDGFGDSADCQQVPSGQTPPPGSVPNGDDCADDEPNAFPGSAELDDPDGCLLDVDGDGWGDPTPPGGIVAGRDCDDADVDRIICVEIAPGCVDTNLGLGTQFTTTVSGGDGNYAYAWTPAATLDDPTIADPIATPTAITTYTVEVTDGLANTGTASSTLHLSDASWVLGGAEAECEAVGFFGPATSHSFANDGTTTCTTSNDDPTAFVCPAVYQNARITGTMVVNTNVDDDIIGFVWGWQDADRFYLFQWKQGTQNWNGCQGQAGMSVKLVDRVEDYGAQDFACNFDTANVTVLLGPSDITTTGWIDNRTYGVDVRYATDQTEITITDLVNDTIVADFVVVDDTYPSGRFGTYDLSQNAACSGPWSSSCL